MSGCKDCQIAQKRIEDLEEKLAILQFEFSSLKSKMYKPGKKKPPDDTPPPVPKKKGGLFGHAGWFRQKPSPGRIDRIEEARLDKCPSCGSYHITECKHIEEHIQEDIILPTIETVLYKHHYYYSLLSKLAVIARSPKRSEGRRSNLSDGGRDCFTRLRLVRNDNMKSNLKMHFPTILTVYFGHE